MKKILNLIIIIFLTLFVTKISEAKEVAFNTNNNSYVKNKYDIIKNNFESYSDWWQVGVIGHREHVYLKSDSIRFYQEEKLSYDTDYSTATSITYTKSSGFSKKYCVSFSQAVSKAVSSAYSVKIGVENTELSNSSEIVNSYSSALTTEYSEQYEYNVSVNLTYDLNKYNVPDDCSICLGTVGDYFLVKGESVEEKVWWGKTYQIENTRKEFDVKIIVYKYQTLFFSDGTYIAKTARDYVL